MLGLAGAAGERTRARQNYSRIRSIPRENNRHVTGRQNEKSGTRLKKDCGLHPQDWIDDLIMAKEEESSDVAFCLFPGETR